MRPLSVAPPRRRRHSQRRRFDGYRESAAKRGYDREWREASAAYLVEHPWCVYCLRRGKHTRARVVDHIDPHKGDPVKFWDIDNWQSLCKPCHDRDKQRDEKRGYVVGSDLGGRPFDKAHPWSADRGRRWPYSIPDGVRPSGIPVHLVCGAPGSGKTTFVRAHAAPGDLVIDFDDIRQSLGFQRYSPDRREIMAALVERSRIIKSLADRCEGEAWLIAAAPTNDERAQWREALGDVTVHAIDTPSDECKRRIRSDPTRIGFEDVLCSAVDAYFDKAGEGRKNQG